MKITAESIAVMGILLAILGCGLFVLISQNKEPETVPVLESETYRLTIGVVNPESGSVNPSGGIYEKDTIVHLYADTDHIFYGWSGDIVGCQQLEWDELIVPMDSDRCIFATFSSKRTSGINMSGDINKILEAYGTSLQELRESYSQSTEDEIDWNKKLRDANVEIYD